MPWKRDEANRENGNDNEMLSLGKRKICPPFLHTTCVPASFGEPLPRGELLARSPVWPGVVARQKWDVYVKLKVQTFLSGLGLRTGRDEQVDIKKVCLFAGAS